jgi:hypothetical protein
MPDAALFAAAERGDLDGTAGIEAQAQRLLADPRARPAVAAFFAQWLDLQRLDEGSRQKSASLFPKYEAATATSVTAGLARFVDWVFWEKNGSLPELLTTPRAFVDAKSAPIAEVSAPAAGLTLVDTDPARRVGLFGQPGFGAGLGHETLPATILRGVWVLDRMLCAPPLPPPNNVSVVLPDPKPGVTTNRARIETLHEVGACAGCHKLIDGAGFALENYDAIGRWQATDGGLPIDARGALLGTFDADGTYDGPVALAQRLARSEQVAECATAQMLRNALARQLEAADACELARLTDALVARPGWPARDLFALVATSDAFRTLDRTE